MTQTSDPATGIVPVPAGVVAVPAYLVPRDDRFSRFMLRT